MLGTARNLNAEDAKVTLSAQRKPIQITRNFFASLTFLRPLRNICFRCVLCVQKAPRFSRIVEILNPEPP